MESQLHLVAKPRKGDFCTRVSHGTNLKRFDTALSLFPPALSTLSVRKVVVHGPQGQLLSNAGVRQKKDVGHIMVHKFYKSGIYTRTSLGNSNQSKISRFSVNVPQPPHQTEQPGNSPTNTNLNSLGRQLTRTLETAPASYSSSGYGFRHRCSIFLATTNRDEIGTRPANEVG